jgi:hypothetical protein
MCRVTENLTAANFEEYYKKVKPEILKLVVQDRNQIPDVFQSRRQEVRQVSYLKLYQQILIFNSDQIF